MIKSNHPDLFDVAVNSSNTSEDPRVISTGNKNIVLTMPKDNQETAESWLGFASRPVGSSGEISACFVSRGPAVLTTVWRAPSEKLAHIYLLVGGGLFL